MLDKYAKLTGHLGLGELARVAGLFKIPCDGTETDILLNLPPVHEKLQALPGSLHPDQAGGGKLHAPLNRARGDYQQPGFHRGLP